MQMFNPSHPGAILREFMGKKITVTALAKHLGIPRGNLSMLLNGRLGVSPTIAVKLAEAFPNTDAELWLGLQAQYDLAPIRTQKRAKIEPVFDRAA
jgi:addiction module HigA family antidote